jgi:uncharacterized protein YndB with AHSA1/START domain
MTQSTVAHDTFVIDRTYDIPIARVFRAWADPVLKARWFAGSAKALGAGYELDLRVGGREINRGGPRGGPVYTYESQFRDIVPEQRTVYTYEMSADEKRLSVSVATVQFHNDDATTRLVLTEQGVFLDSHDTVAQREEGTRSLLDSQAATLLGGIPGGLPVSPYPFAAEVAMVTGQSIGSTTITPVEHRFRWRLRGGSTTRPRGKEARWPSPAAPR